MARKTLQDVQREREQADFVGRQEEIAFFRQNLAYDLTDDRRRLVLNISGQGGVGKTQLIHRFREIVAEPAPETTWMHKTIQRLREMATKSAPGEKETQAVTAYVDGEENDVPQVMKRIADNFAEQKQPLKSFARRYQEYLDHKREIEADPAAPQGFSGLLGRTLARGGLGLARQVPVGGVIADLVDEEEVADFAGEFAAYVARKLRNRDDARLVLDPVGTLTPLFLDDLAGVTERHLAALFFDTYERSSDFLDPWLRNLLGGEYGDVPLNILIVIAGRDELDRNQWNPHERFVKRLPLEPLSEEEARDYLAQKGVHDERTVEVILRLSGRLPLLVATLASQSPTDPAKVGDPSGEAVKRFLEWIEPARREVALRAALPRYLNRDVLATIVDESDDLFDWLRERPFVTKGQEGWVYHDVVRQQLLHYKQQDAPQSWARLHSRLAQYYAAIAVQPGATWEEIRSRNQDVPPDAHVILTEAIRNDPAWQKHMLEVLYHRLCQAPQLYLTAALDGFLQTLKAHRDFARRWATTVAQAEEDAGLAQPQRWGQRLVLGVEAYEESRYQDASTLFTALLEHQGIEKALALGHRGVTHLLRGNTLAALGDFDRALELAPENTWVMAHRGETYRQMGQYPQALADLNRAIELQPDYAWAVVLRGEVSRQMERYEDAVQDFSRALESEPDNAWILVLRGEAYWQMERYEDARADFGRAIALEPNNAWAIAQRGETFRQMARFQEALDDFNRAIDVDEEYVWAIALRGETLRQMGQQEQALGAFQRALALEPQNTWLLVLRGQVYLQMQRYEQARDSFDQAIALEPDNAWAIAHRGEAHRLDGRYDEAREDFDRAIDADPDYAWALALRGELNRQTGRYREAVEDFSRALELEPENVWVLVLRGEAYRQMSAPQDAQADFDRAVTLEPHNEWARSMRDNFLEELEGQEGSSGGEHG